MGLRRKSGNEPLLRKQRRLIHRARRPTLVRRHDARYSTSMKLAFELPPAQADKLREEAKRLGLAPEDLARAALADLLATPDAEFRAVAARILQKNQELYKRLA